MFVSGEEKQRSREGERAKNNEKEGVEKRGVGGGGDHRAPFAYIRNTMTKKKTFKRTIYNYSKLDTDTFGNLLA